MTAAGPGGGGPHGPERDERVTLPATERLGRTGQGPVLVALVVAAAFLVGVVRPWDWLAPGSASPGTGRVGVANPSAGGTDGSGAGPGTSGDGDVGTTDGGTGMTAAPAPATVVAPTCAYPLSWRLASVGDWGGRTARVSSAADAVAATGPGDPRIPFTSIASTTVEAFGWCAPVSGSERPPLEAAATLFRLGSDGPREIAHDRLEPAAPNALGELWMPVRQSSGRSPWPPGRYVIRLAAPGGGFERFLGIEVVKATRANGSPAAESPAAESPSISPPAAESLAAESPVER